jgi:hypothetical protein
MKTFEELLEEYNKAEVNFEAAKEALNNHEDGYIYVLLICSYGSKTYDIYKNSYVVDKERENWMSGENGISHLYTNNPEYPGGFISDLYTTDTREELIEKVKVFEHLL